MNENDIITQIKCDTITKATKITDPPFVGFFLGFVISCVIMCTFSRISPWLSSKQTLQMA